MGAALPRSGLFLSSKYWAGSLHSKMVFLVLSLLLFKIVFFLLILVSSDNQGC